MNKPKDKITKNDLKHYRAITEKAFKIVEQSITKGKEQQAKEIIEMVGCYLSDSNHFENNGDLINAFGAIYYAHGWLDCGARLKVFNVTDSNLFTV